MKQQQKNANMDVYWTRFPTLWKLNKSADWQDFGDKITTYSAHAVTSYTAIFYWSLCPIERMPNQNTASSFKRNQQRNS